MILVLFASSIGSAPGWASVWRYSASVDQLTDERVSRAWTEITGAILNARCRSGLLELYVAKSLYVAGDHGLVRYRIDKRPLVVEIWSPSKSSTGVFAPEAATMARALRSGNRLLVEVSDFRGTPSRLTFSLAGAAVALSKVLTDCAILVDDPRALDENVWRRVAQELDAKSRDDVIVIQKALNVLSSTKINERGVRDLATYQVASRVYEAYWDDCTEMRISGGQCSDWHARKAHGGEPRYPGSMVDIVTDRIAALNNPRFAAVIPPPDRSKPIPRGRPEGWITPEDYPISMYLKNATGGTTVELRVAADGRIARCDVRSSSGWPELDEHTCRLLTRRGRYEPALDGDGQPIAMPVQYSTNWKVPE